MFEVDLTSNFQNTVNNQNEIVFTYILKGKSWRISIVVKSEDVVEQIWKTEEIILVYIFDTYYLVSCWDKT